LVTRMNCRVRGGLPRPYTVSRTDDEVIEGHCQELARTQDRQEILSPSCQGKIKVDSPLGKLLATRGITRLEPVWKVPPLVEAVHAVTALISLIDMKSSYQI
jgi:hypothetical protein